MAGFEYKRLDPQRIGLKHYTRNFFVDLAAYGQIYIGVIAVLAVGHVVLPLIGTGLLTFIAGRVNQIKDVVYENGEIDWERM